MLPWFAFCSQESRNVRAKGTFTTDFNQASGEGSVVSCPATCRQGLSPGPTPICQRWPCCPTENSQPDALHYGN